MDYLGLIMENKTLRKLTAISIALILMLVPVFQNTWLVTGCGEKEISCCCGCESVQEVENFGKTLHLSGSCPCHIDESEQIPEIPYESTDRNSINSDFVFIDKPLDNIKIKIKEARFSIDLLEKPPALQPPLYILNTSFLI